MKKENTEKKATEEKEWVNPFTPSLNNFIDKIDKSIAEDEKYLQEIANIRKTTSQYTIILHPKLRGFIQEKVRYTAKEIEEEKQTYGKATHEVNEIKENDNGDIEWKTQWPNVFRFASAIVAIAIICVLWETAESSLWNWWRLASKIVIFTIGSFNMYRLIIYWASDLNTTNRSGFWHIANLAPFIFSILAFMNGSITEGAMLFFFGLILSFFLGYIKIKIGIIAIIILMFIAIVWDASIISTMINEYAKNNIQNQGLQSIMIARWLSIFLLGSFEIILNLKIILLPLGICYLFYQLLTVDEMFDRNLLRNY